MSSMFGIIGLGLATAAESYLRSVSPQAALERETLAAKRRAIPRQEEAAGVELEQARRKLNQPTIQALGGDRGVACWQRCKAGQ